MQIGSRVLIKNPHKYTSLNNEMQNLQKHSVYGVISSETASKGYTRPDAWQLYVNYFSAGNTKRYIFQQADLEEIAEKDFKKYEEIAAAYEKEAFKHILDTEELFRKPSTGNYSQIDCNKNIRILKNNLSAITLYVYTAKCTIDFKTGQIKEDLASEACRGQIGFKADCCDYIKTKMDFVYYLPTYYLNYYGYSIYDVHKWLQFLENCQIEFKYILEGECAIPKCYEKLLTPAEKDRDFVLNSSNYTIFPGGKSTFVEIKVKNHADEWHCHLHLMLLRYLHHNNHWYIPALAMQIKDALEDKVSNWEALMMAHLGPNYLTERGLVHMGYQTKGLLNCFADPKVIVNNIRTKHKMWESFEYLPDRINDIPKCKTFITNKDYEGLYNFLKNAK